MSFSKTLSEGTTATCREPIAVVGMSCRLPSANNISEFWDLLTKGENAVGPPPNYRWKIEQYPNPSPGMEEIQAGFLSVPIDEFDAKFFEVSPKEAAAMDPQHRLLLEVVWESFEDAALNPQKLRGTRGGVFLGSWLNPYKEILELRTKTSASKNFYQNYKGTCVGVGASRISQLLGWTGPCMGTESDCSAGLTSVSMACKSLQIGDCNIAIACGVNLLVTPFTLENLPAILSPDFRCKTFDADANGFARAEGVGALLLKRYTDAVKDGDRIWGIVRGTAVSQEGLSSSMGTPTAASQIEAITLALEDAGVDPSLITYVEAHGTGTQVGDSVEMEGIREVYGNAPNRKEVLTIGSVKTNLGHTESCSGIAGLIKVLLCMNKEFIPPLLHFKRINPRINLEGIKAKLSLGPIVWPRNVKEPRFAGVSSFGLAGKNCHAIVEEAPILLQKNLQNLTSMPKKDKKDPIQIERQCHIMKITAKSPNALNSLLDKYADYFKERLDKGEVDDFNFPDFAFTVNTGRADFNYRAAVIADDWESAVQSLNTGNIIKNNVMGDKASKICFLFTGQGSQYHGMAKTLYKTSPVFQANFDYCNKWIQSRYNFSLKDLYLGDEDTGVNTQRTLFSQTGIFVVEYCLMRLWQSWGVQPQYILGHSLGEFCAATCSGVLDIDDALKLVAERSRLIDKLPPGKMLVVQANKEAVDGLQKEFIVNNKLTAKLDYAAFNADDQTVVAGSPNDISKFQDFLKNAKGIKCTQLKSNHAFHSKYMDPILEEYYKIAKDIKYRKPADDIIFISGMLGKVMEDLDANYWVRHTREPVNFINACKVLQRLEKKSPIYLEIGPQPVLCSLVMLNQSAEERLLPPLCLASLRRNTKDWNTILNSLGQLFVTGGVEIDWVGFDKCYKREKIGHLVPKYPFQRTKFWTKLPHLLLQTQKQFLHPLLGTKLANPTSTVLFQSEIPTSSPDHLEYLREHRIGDKIILPGAAYIEMMLAAGASSIFSQLEQNTKDIQFPTTPLQLKNLRFTAPIKLDEDFNENEVLCQTTLEKVENIDYEEFKVSVFNQHQQVCPQEEKSNVAYGTWICNASSQFLPHCYDFGDDISSEFKNLLNFTDKKRNLELVKSLKETGEYEDIESLIKTIYNPNKKSGLNFGERFRSLRNIWKCWKSHQFLAELETPETGKIEDDLSKRYFLHPILIDAMIQTTGFPHFDKEIIEGKKNLQLLIPTGCKNFVWIKPLTTKRCFVYSPNLDLMSAMLLDENGGLVAVLNQMDMTKTTLESINSVLNNANLNSTPNLYIYEWTKTDSPLCRFDLSNAPNSVDVARKAPTNMISAITSPVSFLGQTKPINDVDRLASLFIQKALVRLGWPLEQESNVSEENLFKNFRVEKKQRMALVQFLNILEQDKIVKKMWEKNNTSNQYFVNLQPFPSLEALENEIGQIIKHHCQSILKEQDKDNLQISLEQANILFLALTGQNLHKYLTGEESALATLYPENDLSIKTDSISAPRYYEIAGANLKTSLRSLFKKYLKEIKEAHFKREANKANGSASQIHFPTLRILEVGAGTGTATSDFLETLEETQIPFEYVLTDISSAFFSTLEQKFKKYGDKVKYKKLNIEEDPTSQGFPPRYFDVVLAAHVIHATRDIKESLLHIRKLIRNDGSLWMSEIIEKDRVSDCTFGLLEGFWRFVDLQLRPNHCTLSAEKWKKVTLEMGFSDFHYLQDGAVGLLISLADKKGGCKSSFANLQNQLCSPVKELHSDFLKYPKWLIFHGDEDEKYAKQLYEYFEEIGRKNVCLFKVSSPSLSDPPTITKNLSSTQRNIQFSDVDVLHASEIEASALEGIIVTWGLSTTSIDFQEHCTLARPYFELLQSLIKRFSVPNIPIQLGPPPVFVLTRGQYPVGDILCEDPSPSSLIGMTLVALNEHKNLKAKFIDIDNDFNQPDSLSATLWPVFQEILTNWNKEAPILVYRNNGSEKWTPKLTWMQRTNKSLELPTVSDRFRLHLSPSRTIEALQFETMSSSNLQPNEIEVKVVCTALNFRDIFTILKPIPYFEDLNQVGTDIAGVVTQVGSQVHKWKAGDKVFGMHSMNEPLPSHVKIIEDNVVQIPPYFTFAEAASIPVVFSSAHHSLTCLAKAKTGDTVLIHTASGGVGLLAIQIAQKLGLNLICTAGSERKRAYLRSLGVTHVFDSRSTHFEKQILEITNGKGVDIVLNSLTGPGFKEATLRACGIGARFIELSKLNVWNHDEVKALRPDVSYKFLDSSIFDVALTQKELTTNLSDWIKSKSIRPIPYTRFDAGDIREALQYLQKAKQIGKVIIAMPQQSTIQTQNNQFPAIRIRLFNDRSSYLITGGLGGIGLEVCKYMINQGAKHMVLVGRRAPDRKISKILENLEQSFKCKITVLQGDVGSLEDCKNIFEHISKNLPPLRGVMHSAGTLSDRMFIKLEWSDFLKTYRPKVEGSWNLHWLTKDLNLEHFVLFSSIVCKLGPVGQTTHASACNFQDAFANFRRSHGLPTITINWGQWGEVGVARNMHIQISEPFSLRQGINALDLILRKNLETVIAVKFREKTLAATIEPLQFMKSVIDEKVLAQFAKQSSSESNAGLTGSSSMGKIKSESFWEEYDACGNSLEEKNKISKIYVGLMLRNVLRMDHNDVIHEESDLSGFGMDSLMMIELFNLMQSTCGRKVLLHSAVIKECKTLKSLATKFVEMIERQADKKGSANIDDAAKKMETIHELSRRDAELPSDIQVEVPHSFIPSSEIKCLLLTGSTGLLGSHMLKELLEGRPQLQKIYCLVRGDQPLQRLCTVLKKNKIELTEKQMEDKITVLSGDFSHPNLGLSLEKYLKISKEVEGILHLGATVNHSCYYEEVPGSYGDLRSVNVGGLLNILKFACKSRTKHVFHASSLITVWDKGEHGALQEAWPGKGAEKLAAFNTYMGYPISKIINELHLKQAVIDRGIPCKAFRYPELRSSSTSPSKSFAENSHILKMAIFLLKEAVIPVEPLPLNLMPTDIAAKLTVKLMFNDEAPNEPYNFTNPQNSLVRDSFPIIAAELGFTKPSQVKFEEFSRRVVQRCLQIKDEIEKGDRREAKGSSSDVLIKTIAYEFQRVYQDKNLFQFFVNYGNSTFDGVQNCNHFWRSKKLSKFVPQLYSKIEPSSEIMKKDLQAALLEGILDLL